MIGNIEKKSCTGCKMCADICPVDAISFTQDNEGFWYPSVNMDTCLECGLCDKRCPSLNNKEINGTSDPNVYSAWSKDDEVRITSTSGGIFWTIAKKFIDLGGIVFGSAYGNDWKSAYHTVAKNEKDLYKLKGSKYFQSDTEGVYKKVKEELDNGVKVLFCGTPCQNAALISYLDKQFENLYLMDFICRSINSPKAFSAYISELEEQFSSCAKEVHLKNKKNGWQSLASQVKFENGEESILDKENDWWVKGFIYNDLYTRESCFHCPYKVLPRISSDITIGDFWGIKGQTSEDLFKGISVMLINTEKGKQLLESAEDDLIIRSHTIDEVKAGNPALYKNPIRSNKQDKFFELLEKHPFSFCVKQCTKLSLFQKLKKVIKKILKESRFVISILYRRKISLRKYIYYNYLCKNIVRKNNAKIIPYKGAILDLSKTSRIYLSGKNLVIGGNCLRKAKSETHIRMDDNAIWYCKNGAFLFYNTVVEIKSNAVLDTGYFSANGGSVIIAHKKIELGEDVMMGRNIIIYDSDFHTIYNSNGITANPPKPVKIEDHVWLTTNVMVQKGVTIGKDSLISAYTVVNKDMPPHSIIGGRSNAKVIKDQICWSREICRKENDI